MNERIKELAVQAGLNWKVQPLHFTNTSNPVDFPISVNHDLEKFAELIVAECIQVGGPEDSYTDDWFKAKADSINKIKEHFGVEE